MAQAKKPDIENNPESFSTATNLTDALQTYEEREKYRDEIFPEIYPFSFFNFWQQDHFYGRINSFGNAVLLREDRLKQLRFSRTNSTVYALNFVADAWRDYVEKIRELIMKGSMENSGPYAEMTAVKGWSSIPAEYHDYMTSEVYPSFSDIFVSLMGNNNRKIKDFDSYLGVFGKFCETALTLGGPITLSGYTESLLCSPLNTGLVVEISSDNHDEDFAKCNNYLNDINFLAAARIASNYGFVIDKNAPWRFVADIRSPAMREYMTGVPPAEAPTPVTNELIECDVPYIKDYNVPEPYGYSNIDGIRNCLRHAPGYPEYQALIGMSQEQEIFETFFKQTYIETWRADMDLLKVYILDFYNTYVSSVPVVSTRVFRENLKCVNPLRGEFKTETFFREIIPTFDEVFSPDSGKYRDKWSLRCYYNLRMLERKTKKKDAARLKDVQEFMNIYYFAPPEPVGTKYMLAMGHVQNKLVGPITDDFLTYDTLGGIKRT
jgi:hypothetical protein